MIKTRKKPKDPEPEPIPVPTPVEGKTVALIETYDIAQASSFRHRLIACIVKTAGGILNEESPAEERVALAQAAVIDPNSIAERFVWPMLSNPSIAASGIQATDADLEYQCSQVWDIVAGVK